MDGTFTITAAARPAALGRVLDRFGAFAGAHGIRPDVRRDVYLALDEIVSNVVHHGCAGRAGCRVTVNMRLEEGRLVVEVIDDGRPFNPLTARKPRVEAALEDRPIGGLGVYLTRRLMDRLSYRRRGGRNHLVFERAFTRARAGSQAAPPATAGPGPGRPPKPRTGRRRA
ncbi:MAG: ATP-binding protein [Betaproteobacteria bacterium]